MRLQTKIKVDSYCIFSSTSTHEYLIQIIGHTVLYGCVQCLAPGHIFVYQLDSGSTIYRPSRCKRTYPLVPGPLSNMLDKGWRSCPPPLKPLHWIKVWLTWCFYLDANRRKAEELFYVLMVFESIISCEVSTKRMSRQYKPCHVFHLFAPFFDIVYEIIYGLLCVKLTS